MAGSTTGNIFRVTTWGESHGPALGCVVDGVPAGIPINEELIQEMLDRRKPGQSRFTTQRKESDLVHILSGVFEGKSTGTPISLVIYNEDQHSKDYSNIMDCYRPGHADYGFDVKYGFRDYRGGGRSSGRETAARVAAGAVAAALLSELGITVTAYTRSVGPVCIESFDPSVIRENALYMPDPVAADKAAAYLNECMEQKDSTGGVIECRIDHVPAGLGDPVFEKLDANLARAILSIGAVKGFELGDGFEVAAARGSENNDPFRIGSDGSVSKASNHAGGILGGISDGSQIIFRAAVKPTPSIARVQQTVNRSGQETDIEIRGRHDPIIVPRAVVVVEAMAAITLADALLMNMSAKMDTVKKFYLD